MHWDTFFYIIFKSLFCPLKWQIISLRDLKVKNLIIFKKLVFFLKSQRRPFLKSLPHFLILRDHKKMNMAKVYKFKFNWIWIFSASTFTFTSFLLSALCTLTKYSASPLPYSSNLWLYNSHGPPPALNPCFHSAPARGVSGALYARQVYRGRRRWALPRADGGLPWLLQSESPKLQRDWWDRRNAKKTSNCPGAQHCHAREHASLPKTE